MQIQKIQNNNNYNTNFRQKLLFDTKTITRATRDEKHELAILKNMFKNNGIKGDIKIKENKNNSIQDIIENLKLKYRETKKLKA
jgi:hypothetical protein